MSVLSAPEVAPEVLARLKQALGDGGWADDAFTVGGKLTEWRGRWTGHTPLLLTPRTTAEVQAAVRICAEAGVAITPQGGNTGLVGGQIPYGEILLSTSKLRSVRDVSPLDDVMIVEAGITLLEAQQIAEKAGRHFPLSLAAEGSATVGGVISTNAGGTAVLRYGVTRDLVLGLEVVLPNGELFPGLKRLRKDNTGYDLKQLFIGAEGTLGIVTAAALKLFPIMNARATAIVALTSPHAAVELLARAKSETGGGVEAFELMGRVGFAFVLKNTPGARDPFETVYDWYALIEVASGEVGAAESGLQRILETAFDNELILDAALAQNETQAEAFWRLREEHSAAQKVEGAAWKHDVSVPVSKIADFIDQATAAVKANYPGVRVVAFGHVGDGNVHFDVLQPEGADPKIHTGQRDAGSRLIHDLVHDFEGSISAEHGLGRMKTAEALPYKSEAELTALRAVRAALDPQRIMNPKVLF